MKTLVARVLFRLFYASQSLGKNRGRFSRHMTEVNTIVQEHQDSVLCGREQVPASPGLTEVMRDWSPYMTIHHLNLVHREIIDMIKELEAGRMVEIGDLSRFDHFDEQAASVMTDFNALGDDILRLPEQLSFTSSLKVYHPIFGSLTSKDYYAMLVMHLKLHVDQIKKSVELNS